MIYFNTGQSRFNSSKSSTNVKIVRISKYHFFSIPSPPQKNKNLKLKTKISQQISDFKNSLNRLIKNSYFLSFFFTTIYFFPTIYRPNLGVYNASYQNKVSVYWLFAVEHARKPFMHSLAQHLALIAKYTSDPACSRDSVAYGNSFFSKLISLSIRTSLHLSACRQLKPHANFAPLYFSSL